jgi:hypothetical protein
VIEERARAAYAQREVKYPVEHALTFAYGGADGSADNPYAAEYIRTWVLDKYGVDLPLEQIRSSTVRQLCDVLVKYQAEFLAAASWKNWPTIWWRPIPDSEALRKALNERFKLRY